jgi:toxin ParE1/3/4
MNRVRTRPEADADLIEIGFHIAQDDLAAADHLVDSLTEKFAILAQDPEMGRLRDDLAPSLRSFVTDTYIIFYQPTKHGIAVVRVLHASRAIPALFSLRGSEMSPREDCARFHSVPAGRRLVSRPCWCGKPRSRNQREKTCL